MADTYITIGSTGTKKKLVDLGDGTYADASAAMPRALSTELVVAGADSVLGKIAAPVNAETIYIRQAVSPGEDIEWRVQSNTVHTIQKYKARTNVNSATITLAAATRVDDEDTFTLNGLTYTAEATAADAAYASRKWKSGGDDEDADAAALAALINADYAVATAGTSVATEDKLTITTDEGAHVIVAAAAADYPAGKYGLSAVVATELASIVAAINHKDNVTCASVAANDTVVVNGLTFTAHATTTTAASRQFSVSGDNDADAAQLVVCLNDATYGVPGLTAVAVANVVSFTRDSQDDTVTLTTSNATRLKTEAAGGVPGVIAAATGATGELSITPTWTSALTVAEAGDQLTVTKIDIPGILATVDEDVITLTCTTPGGGEEASVIQFGQGTSTADEIAFADTTLASLVLDGDVVTDAVANATTAGKIYSQTMNGWEYGYLGLTNKSGSGAMTAVVGATLH